MKLKEWMKMKKYSIYRFCKMYPISEGSMKKYIEGGIPRRNVAARIVKITGGVVTLKDLGVKK